MFNYNDNNHIENFESFNILDQAIISEKPTYFLLPYYELSGWLGRTCEWIKFPSHYCVRKALEGGTILKIILIIPTIVFAILGNGINDVIHRIAAEKVKDYDQVFNDFAKRCKGPSEQHFLLTPQIAKFIDEVILMDESRCILKDKEFLFLNDVTEKLSLYNDYCDHKFKTVSNYKPIIVFFCFVNEMQETRKFVETNMKKENLKQLAFMCWPVYRRKSFWNLFYKD